MIVSPGQLQGDDRASDMLPSPLTDGRLCGQPERHEGSGSGRAGASPSDGLKSVSDVSGGARVLLVDDHADMLALMRMMMERRSYLVATAQSGEQALEMAPDFGPHVVISDIGMPGMDGYELMQTLRSMDALPPFKSIALSGYDAREEASRATAAGYDAQLTKPIDFDSLFKAIEAFLPRAE